MKNRIKKNLLNESEFQVLSALNASALENEACVLEKVRVADVFSIDNSGISVELFSFAMKSHFDFLVCRGRLRSPVFAVEFDGKLHEEDPATIERDRKKNEICKIFDLPLLRFDSSHFKIVGKSNMVAWLTNLWFVNEEWEKNAPPDEMFNYSFWFKASPEFYKAFDEMWNNGEAIINGRLVKKDDADSLTELQKIMKLGPDTDMDPFLQFRLFLSRARDKHGIKYYIDSDADKSRNYWGFTFVEFPDGTKLAGTGKMKVDLWPGLCHDIAIDLSMEDAAMKTRHYLKTGNNYRLNEEYEQYKMFLEELKAHKG